MAERLRQIASAELATVLNRPCWHVVESGWITVASHLTATALCLPWDDDGDEGDDCGYTVTPEGVAIIPVCGTLVDAEPSWWYSYLGYCSTPALARAIAAANLDASVKSGLFVMDSPGGQVSGLYAACQAAWEFRQSGKKLWSHCKMACSAAYELASQCDRIHATEDSMDGCLGTKISLADWSGYFAQQGIKMLTITSKGAETYKGEGEFGTEITREQRADFKRICDEYRTIFNGVIVRGRPSIAAQLSALADGRVHIGRYALALGLIDAVATRDEVLAALGTDADVCGSTDLPRDPNSDDGTSPEDRQVHPASRPGGADNRAGGEETEDMATAKEKFQQFIAWLQADDAAGDPAPAPSAPSASAELDRLKAENAALAGQVAAKDALLANTTEAAAEQAKASTLATNLARIEKAKVDMKIVPAAEAKWKALAEKHPDAFGEAMDAIEAGPAIQALASGQTVDAKELVDAGATRGESVLPKLEALVDAYMKAHDGVQRHDAMNAVCKANKDLAAAYYAETQKGNVGE